MQVEQVIGGVEGDQTAQAIQLRMRLAGQQFVGGSQIRVWDATGSNPVLVADPAVAVADGSAGARVLFTSASFDALTTPAAINDFPMLALIPESYLAAGSLTFRKRHRYDRLLAIELGRSGVYGPDDGLDHERRRR